MVFEKLEKGNLEIESVRKIGKTTRKLDILKDLNHCLPRVI